MRAFTFIRNALLQTQLLLKYPRYQLYKQAYVCEEISQSVALSHALVGNTS